MTVLKIKQSGSWVPIAGEVNAQNPINDAITQLGTRCGFRRYSTVTQVCTGGANNALNLASVATNSGNAWTGGPAQFTCAVPGVYTVQGVIGAGGTPFTVGSYIGIMMQSAVILARDTSANVTGFNYETLNTTITMEFLVGQTISLVFYPNGGNYTTANNPGSVNDPAYPSLHVWKISE